MESFGTHAFTAVQQAVQEMLRHHIADGTTADPSIADRAVAMADPRPQALAPVPQRRHAESTL